MPLIASVRHQPSEMGNIRLRETVELRPSPNFLEVMCKGLTGL